VVTHEPEHVAQWFRFLREQQDNHIRHLPPALWPILRDGTTNHPPRWSAFSQSKSPFHTHGYHHGGRHVLGRSPSFQEFVLQHALLGIAFCLHYVDPESLGNGRHARLGRRSCTCKQNDRSFSVHSGTSGTSYTATVRRSSRIRMTLTNPFRNRFHTLPPRV